MRLAGARTGFLRYAVAAGAVTGAFAAGFAAGASGRAEIGGVMVGGTFVGFSIGMVVGWTTFRIVERVAKRAMPGWPVAWVIAVGLVLPAYLVAGVTASIAGALVLGMPSAKIERLMPDVLTLLVLFGLVCLPIAAAFGRSDRARPATLSAALAGFDDLTVNPSGTSRTFWGVAIGLTMFVVGFGVALLLLLAVQSIVQGIAPGAWERLTREFGAVFGVALIGLWVVVGVVGWKITMRFIDWLRRPAA